MDAITLHRIDRARNMRRFYRLDIEADLFGGFLLLKQWGRMGTRGRVVAEHFEGEAPAIDALQKQAERKRRKGYVSAVHFQRLAGMKCYICNSLCFLDAFCDELIANE